MDVHKDAITIAVMNSAGKVIMESIIETKAVTILRFIQGLRADVFVTFEEGTWAAWLYDLLKPHVTKVVVCNPRKSALLKDGSKGRFCEAQSGRSFHHRLGPVAPRELNVWYHARRSCMKSVYLSCFV
jgi:hypothetical protein